MSDPILFEKTGGIAAITFNRPDVCNALTLAMCNGIIDFISGLNEDGETRILLLRGNGRDFCSGVDLRGMADVTKLSAEQRRAHVQRDVVDVSQTLFRALANVQAPVITSLRGYAIGAGMQFVLSADLVVASETAKLAVPLTRLGHTTDHGESWYLPRKIGAARAMQVLLLGEFIAAAEAERFGLVNWVTADDALEARTAEIIATIQRGAPKAMFGMKALLRDSLANSLEAQFAAELAAVANCAATEDFVEALTATTEKRKPVFQNR
jgi:2-(1,2-epoxy-1,2-dihydrophenyl)acetyl-CoA isomerase